MGILSSNEIRKMKYEEKEQKRRIARHKPKKENHGEISVQAIRFCPSP